MATSESKSAGALPRYLRFCAWVLAAAAALAALGYLPTRKLAGDGAVESMLAALGAVAAGSIVGGLPIFMAQLRSDAKPGVVIVSMVVRLVAVVLVAAFLALLLELETPALLVWLALSYLLLLVVDTRYAMGVLGGP